MRCAVLSAGAMALVAGVASGEFVPDEAIVWLSPGADIADINVDYGTTTIDSIPNWRIFLLDLPDGLIEDEFEALLEADARVYEVELNDHTDAPGGHTQSFYFNINPGAFEVQHLWTQIAVGELPTSATGNGVTVAIIDTGIDASHPLLQTTEVLPGLSLLGGDVSDVGDGQDTDGDSFIDEMVGHGTFQATLIAALAPEATLLPIRALRGDGDGNVFDVAKGVYAAIDAGATVINLSLGTPEENKILVKAIEDANEQGAVVVTSVGNSGSSEPKFYPAAVEEAITVASVDAADVLATFSSRGSHVDLCAPGVEIVGGIPGNEYGQSDGTSAAAAIVSAAVALVRQSAPDAVPEQVMRAIIDSTVNVDVVNPGFIGDIGSGRLDVAAAVELISNPTSEADVNGDGVVDFGDVLVILVAWGTDGGPADIDESGQVGFGDVLVVLSHWS